MKLSSATDGVALQFGSWLRQRDRQRRMGVSKSASKNCRLMNTKILVTEVYPYMSNSMLWTTVRYNDLICCPTIIQMFKIS